MKNIFRVLIVLMFLIPISASYAEQDADFLFTFTCDPLNTDGTPFTDLDGYRIQWGIAPGSYQWSKNVDKNCNPCSVPIPGGCYYFTMNPFNIWKEPGAKAPEVFLCKGVKTPGGCTFTVE